MSLCQSCHAGCCRSFAVPINGADIIRIENTLGLDFWNFVCRWEDPDGIIARKFAPHFRFDDEPEARFVICLLQAESQFLPGSQKCRFLMECPPDGQSPLGEARCGIYETRPATCRAFPTKFNDSSDLAVIYDVNQEGRSAEHAAYKLCSRQWEPADLEPLSTVQNLVIAKYEMTFFAQLSEAWNRELQPWKIFPEFLRSVYANRVVPESAITQNTPLPESTTLPIGQTPDESIRRAA